MDAGVWGERQDWRDEEPVLITGAPRRLQLDHFEVTSVIKKINSAVECHSSADNNKTACALHIQAAIYFLGEVARCKEWDHCKLPTMDQWREGVLWQET